MIDKRSFLMGYFIGMLDDEDLEENLDLLSTFSNMTPLDEKERNDVGEFMIYVGDMLENKLKSSDIE